MKIEFAITPCPNDTFVHYHLSRGNVAGYPVRLVMADIETLNSTVLNSTEYPYTVAKVSAAIYPKIQDRYDILPCGGAFTLSGGPIFISYHSPEKKTAINKIVTPGAETTACLLIQKYMKLKYPKRKVAFLHQPYNHIFQAMLEGVAEYGVIIHEDRFVFQEHGFFLCEDLGEWWKQKYDVPLPLAVLVVPKNMNSNFRQQIINAIRDSLQKAQSDPQSVYPFVKKYSENLSDQIIRDHIKMFVSSYTFDMTEECEKGLAKLFQENSIAD